MSNESYKIIELDSKHAIGLSSQNTVMTIGDPSDMPTMWDYAFEISPDEMIELGKTLVKIGEERQIAAKWFSPKKFYEVCQIMGLTCVAVLASDLTTHKYFPVVNASNTSDYVNRNAFICFLAFAEDYEVFMETYDSTITAGWVHDKYFIGTNEIGIDEAIKHLISAVEEAP
jgi:hypothetical protein